MRVIVTWLLAFALVAMPAGANEGSGKDNPSRNKTARATKPPTLAETTPPGLVAELQRLKALLEKQSQEMEAQRVALEQQQQRIAALEARLPRSAGTAAPAPQPQPATNAVISSGLPPIPASLLATTPSFRAGGAQYNEEQDKKGSPLAFKIGNADFTLGGFLDFTSVFRSTNVGSGIGTSFGAIPFNNNLPQAALTENRFSAQNSRLSLKVTERVGATNLAGYVESDFLGFQPPNANTTSNSDSLRLRLYFADVMRGKWELGGGQFWTLLTPNRKGLSPYPSDLFYTQDIDTNYQVGLTWARQAGFRVIYHATDDWALGVSLENPQQLAPNSVVFPASSFAAQFDNGSGSTSSSNASSNSAVPNLHPDIIVKTAYDGHVGEKLMHIEAAGLVRSFKVSNSLTTPATNNTLTGGGGSLNFNLELVKNLHLIANSFYSYGGGRYILGLGPDVVVRPDGRLSGVRAGSGIGGFEWQANPHYMLYGYYGHAYFQRNFGLLPASGSSTCAGVTGFTCVGFGFPGSSSSSNRSLQEETIGLIPTIWKSPQWGALQIITQYSYVTRYPWSVAPSNPKDAHTSLAYVDLRYVLP